MFRIDNHQILNPLYGRNPIKKEKWVEAGIEKIGVENKENNKKL